MSGKAIAAAGQRFGRFELREQLGAGGMGTVYRAFDPEADREVALKVLALPLAAFSEAERKALLGRFEREARLAAALDHPGIARVLGAGEADGAPWIAMEIVRGETLAERIRRRRSDPDFRREAARLLAEAAEAIDAAHRRGVLHRDLKPANILVEEATGRARVTDFGLAREIGPGSRITLTQEGQALGTPQYMAPEQARGDLDALDEQTDVYGLGATLYEALTGRPPYDGDVPWKVALSVLRGECEPPRTVDASVPEPLDAICRCAMAREKEARYASAAELASELRAFAQGKRDVRGRPLIPRGPSLWRLLKLAIARNKAVAATIAAALCVLVASAAVFVWRLRIERDRAEERAKVARAALDTLVFEVKQQLRDESNDRVRALRRNLLATALASVERLRALEAGTEEVSLAAAEAHRQIGDLATIVGKLERAAEAYERALEIARAVAAANPESGPARRAVADSLTKVHGSRTERGDVAGALVAAEECLAIRRQLLADYPDVLGVRQWVALALGDVASARRRLGDHAGAREAIEEAVPLARAVLASMPEDPEARVPLAALIGSLGELRLHTGDAKGAREATEEALAIHRGLVEDEPQSHAARALLANALKAAGNARMGMGEREGARAAFEEAAAISRGLLAEDPRSIVTRATLAATLYRLGGLRADEGDLDGAAPLFEEAVALAKSIRAESTTNVVTSAELSRYLNRVGDTRRKKGDEAGARAAFEESLAVARDLVASSPGDASALLDLSVALERVSEMRARAGDEAASRAFLEECLALRRELAAKDPESAEKRRGVAIALLNVGDLRDHAGDVEGARACYEEALAGFRELVKRDPARAAGYREVAAALQRLADALEKLERFDEAIAALDEATAALAPFAARSPQTARELRMFDAQRERALSAKRAKALLAGAAVPETAADHLALGYALYERKEHARAAEHFARALEDAAIRADRARGHLYNGACAAALASGATEGAEAARWRAKALAWLAEDIAAVRAALAEAKDAGARRRLEEHLVHARVNDPDLAAIRGDPAFAKIFEEGAPAADGW